MTTPPCPRCGAPLFFDTKHDPATMLHCPAKDCQYGHAEPRTLIPQPDVVGVATPAIVESMRIIARKHGWALAQHGTMVRDIDLIAVPWIEEAAPWKTVYDEWLATLPLVETEGEHRHAARPQRPHGRRSLLILQAGTVRVDDGNPKGTWSPPALDVSFMPRAHEIVRRLQ